MDSSKTFFVINFITTIYSLKKAKFTFLTEFTIKIIRDKIDGDKRRLRVARSVTYIRNGKIKSERRSFKFVRVDYTVYNTRNTSGIVQLNTSDITKQAISDLQRSSKYRYNFTFI